MEFVVWLDKVGKDDGPIVGGKGANLGEMIGLGMPVPFGFVVTTKAFDYFMGLNNNAEIIRQIIDKTNVDDTKNLIESSDKIKKLIVSQEMPAGIKNEITEIYRNLSYSDRVGSEKLMSLISAGRDMALVAVRSSATTEDLPTASFAGQQATFLNVKGIRNLIDAIKKAWASLYEPRAIFYRKKNGFTHSSIAIIVQRMVNADKSGVMFTINPTTGENNVVIEATWGLGETLVSGAVDPDMYVVSRDEKILSKKIGKKIKMRIRDYATDDTLELNVPQNKISAQVLTDQEITRIAEYGLLLEAHYEKPQDVEFAIEKSRIQIVQTRAVTTHVERIQEMKVEGKIILKGLGASPGLASGKVKIVRGLSDIDKIEKGDILVTTMTSPDLVPTMQKAAAIITDLGGATSHAAIVSREMGIPAIVGTENATKIFKNGQIVTVDAHHGIIYEGELLETVEEKIETNEEKISEPQEISAIPISVGPTVTAVKVNMVFPDKVNQIAPRADGVGLLRIEHMITRAGEHPAKLIRENRREDYIKILIDGISPIASAFNPKPIWVRTLDARSDEFRNLKGGEEESHEDNPMLGWHGIRRSLDEPEILKAEFEAVKRMHENGLTNIHIMFPFVISVEEFLQAKKIAEEIGLPKSAKLGVMIETPAAVNIIDSLCDAGIAFASFGSNDLTMLTLGLDRNNPKLISRYDEMHPAMKKMFSYVIKTCKKKNVEVSICGEGPSNNPQLVEFLVEQGINSISVNMDAIEKVRAKISEVERKILQEILKKK